MAAVDFTPFNQACSKWAGTTVLKARAAGAQLNIQHRPRSSSPQSSLSALKAGTKKTNGITSRISFGFPKVLAYVHYGVGRNRPVGSGKENPKPIFDVVNQELPKLVEVASEAYLEVAMRGIFRSFLK